MSRKPHGPSGSRAARSTGGSATTDYERDDDGKTPPGPPRARPARVVVDPRLGIDGADRGSGGALDRRSRPQDPLDARPPDDRRLARVRLRRAGTRDPFAPDALEHARR